MAVGGQPRESLTMQSIAETDAILSSAEYLSQSGNIFQELIKQSLRNPNLQQELMKFLTSLEQAQPTKYAEFYDAAIAFAPTDRKQAIEVKNFMNRLLLDKDEHPRVCLFDKEEFGGAEVKLPKTLIDRCTLILPLLTDNFEHDKHIQFLNEETVAGTRLADVKQWQIYCVRPLHTKPRNERKYPTPFGLASIRSYDVYNLEDEHTISKFKNLFEYHLPIRKDRENELKKTRSEILKKKEDQFNIVDGEGASINIHSEGRRSLPDEKATQVFDADFKSDQERYKFPPPPTRAYEGHGSVSATNGSSGTTTLEENENLQNASGTQQLSEVGLLNDYVTMRKTNDGESKLTEPESEISFDLKQTKPKVAISAPVLKGSEMVKGREEKQDILVQPTVPSVKSTDQSSCPSEANNANPGTQSLHKKHEKPVMSKEDLALGQANSMDEERHSSVEAMYGSKSLSEEIRNTITETMLKPAPDLLSEDSEDEKDVEEDQTSSEEVPCAGFESNELVRTDDVLQAGTDKNGSSADEEEGNKSADHLLGSDPDQTEIQSLSQSHGEIVNEPTSLLPDSSIDAPGSLVEEASPEEPLSDASNNNEDPGGKEVEKYVNNDLSISSVEEAPVLDNTEKIASSEEITEPVLTIVGPAYTRAPGLCTSPDMEYSNLSKGFSSTCSKDGTSAEKMSGEDEEGIKTSNNSGSNGHEEPKSSEPGKPGTKLPVENVGTTFVYIYNSSNIRIQGENNIHMKDDKSESASEQDKKEMAHPEKKRGGLDPDWLPPHRQKNDHKNRDKSTNHSSGRDQSGGSNMSMKSPGLKMITQGEMTQEDTSQSSSASDLTKSGSLGNAKSSSLVPAVTMKPHVDSEHGKETMEKSDKVVSKNVKDSIASESPINNGSIPVIEVVTSSQQGDDDTRKMKSKKKSRGCFPFSLKRKKKKKTDMVP